ncbi:hypothetical protein ASF24_03505 [Methylobacterium sp. Leaf86]|nr:hypothetical protein ASF24_03505 [Methylobacterium sp. Leaf86]
MHWNFGPHDKITIDHIDYLDPVPTAQGWALSRAANPGLMEQFTHEQIDGFEGTPGWAYEEDWYLPERTLGRPITIARSMSDVPKKEQALTKWKWEYCTRFLTMEAEGSTNRSDEGMEQAISEIHVRVSAMDIATYRIMPEPTPKRMSKRAVGHGSVKQKTAKNAALANVSKARAGDLLGTRKRPSVRTLRRWLKRLQERGLFPWSLRADFDNCGCRTPQITGKAYEFLRKYGRRYASRKRPTIAELHEAMGREVEAYNQDLPEALRIPCPSRKALAAFIDTLPAFLVHAGRYGLQKAKLRFALVTAGPDVTRPFQRIEIDHWTVNLRMFLTAMGFWDRLSRKVQRELGRMHLCAAMDRATRCFVGLKISATPTSADTLAVLRMMVSDKSAYALGVGAATPWDMRGRPEGIAVDAGLALIADQVRLAVAGLGAYLDVPTGGVPNLRGVIERSFRTVDVKLIAQLAGYTFENILARQGQNPDDWAAHDTEEIAWAVCRWVIDAYHNTPHKGLGGETPRNSWLRQTRNVKVRTPPDANTIRHIFGTQVTRTLNNRGILILGLHYWCPALKDLFLARGIIEVEVKVDPLDLGRISVQIGKEWHVATCEAEGFHKVSVATWVRAADELRRTYANQAHVTKQVVNEALRAIERMSASAEARAGIAFESPTPDEMDRIESEILQGWSLPDIATGQREDKPREGGDPLDEGIPTTGGRAPEPDVPPASSPARLGNFRFKR